MNKPKNDSPIFNRIKSGLEEAIAFERGEKVAGVQTRTLTTDDQTVEAVSQRLLMKNKQALDKLGE